MRDLHDQPALTYERCGRSSGRRHRSTGRYFGQSSSRSHHRHGRRRLNPRFLITLAVLLALLIGITVGVRCCTKPTIRGRWDLDGTTIYKFDRNGTGALVLMYAEYEFTYTIEGDRLYIDFEDEAALDAAYTFKVEDRMLFLTGGPGDARNDYVLTKIL